MATERFAYRTRTAGNHTYEPAAYLHEDERAPRDHVATDRMVNEALASPEIRIPGYKPLPRLMQE